MSLLPVSLPARRARTRARSVCRRLSWPFSLLLWSEEETECALVRITFFTPSLVSRVPRGRPAASSTAACTSAAQSACEASPSLAFASWNVDVPHPSSTASPCRVVHSRFVGRDPFVFHRAPFAFWASTWLVAEQGQTPGRTSLVTLLVRQRSTSTRRAATCGLQVMQLPEVWCSWRPRQRCPPGPWMLAPGGGAELDRSPLAT